MGPDGASITGNDVVTNGDVIASWFYGGFKFEEG